jgi:hypothetical protein
MAEYKVIQLKEKKDLPQEMEDTLNEQAKGGSTFVEMERAHRGTSLFFLLVFRKD